MEACGSAGFSVLCTSGTLVSWMAFSTTPDKTEGIVFSVFEF